MLGRSWIGLLAVMVTALVALGASPAYASKKAGVITSGNSVVLLNTSGFAKIELLCDSASQVSLTVDALGNGTLDMWVERTGATLEHLKGGGHHFGGIPKPGHIEWSVSRGTKVALGQVYEAPTGSGGNDCVYTSQVS